MRLLAKNFLGKNWVPLTQLNSRPLPQSLYCSMLGARASLPQFTTASDQFFRKKQEGIQRQEVIISQKPTAIIENDVTTMAIVALLLVCGGAIYEVYRNSGKPSKDIAVELPGVKIESKTPPPGKVSVELKDIVSEEGSASLGLTTHPNMDFKAGDVRAKQDARVAINHDSDSTSLRPR